MCSACQRIEKRIRKIYEKYNNKVNFKFVYFSDYISEAAFACEAASRQNKFLEMHNMIFNNTENTHKDSIYYKFAKRLGLNIKKFKKDMHEKKNLKKLLKNKELLLSNGIYSTPSFIINGKILDNKYSFYNLEDIIKEEIRKHY